MKQYVITEDELRILAGKIQFGYAESDIRNFLADKQEVELIAEGEISYEGEKAWIKNPEYDSKDEAIFKKYSGKSIEIYIKEVK